MGGFGSIWHWVVVLLVIVLLFGAKKIPEVAKGLGSGIKNFKKALKEDELEEELIEAEAEEKPKKVAATTKKASTTKAKTKTKSTKEA